MPANPTVQQQLKGNAPLGRCCPPSQVEIDSLAELAQIEASTAATVAGLAPLPGIETNTGNTATNTSDLLSAFQSAFPPARFDAFGRVRVSEPTTLLDIQTLYTKQPLLMDEILTGGATSTLNTNRAGIAMAVGPGGRAVRQSKQYATYQPGKSLLVEMTAVMRASPSSQATVRVGYFDNTSDKSTGPANGNGVFFQSDGTGNQLVLRSFVSGAQVDTVVQQAAWNVDPMDGTGPSGIVLDTTQSQIFVFDLQFLGVGTVRCGIEVNGILYWCHYFNNANINNSVYMSRASLPVRYEIESTGGSETLECICSTVHSEGGFNPRGAIFSQDTNTTLKSVGTGVNVPLISIRSKAAFNRVTINPASYSAITTSTGSFFIRAYLNATLTGASFASANAESAVEYDTSATVVSGGILLGSVAFSSSTNGLISQFQSVVKLFATIAGVSDVLTITALKLDGGGADTVAASVSWEEWI